MLTYHRSVTDDGGAIGDEIRSGDAGALLPEITLQEQQDGAQVPRKFYIANSGTEDVPITALSVVNDSAVFPAILFESTGDSQTIGDLTGSETDESPIAVTIPAGGHMSFWVRVDVPAGSSVTDSYNAIDIKQIL